VTIGDHIPGHELLNKGMRDLRANEQTEEALLVLIGAWRLRTVLDIPSDAAALSDAPEHLLFSKLEARLGRGAHSAYNALIRRLVSAENALGV
jgi:hypothetical protein